MKKSQFSPTQIASILKEFDGGKTAEEITREHGCKQSFPVQMATTLRWYGSQRVKAHQRTGRRKYPVKTDVFKPCHGTGCS